MDNTNKNVCYDYTDSEYDIATYYNFITIHVYSVSCYIIVDVRSL
jgi:hypothetical protein